MDDLEVTVEQEIANVSVGKPHVVLLGAGASKAALPNGDENGRSVPLLREVAAELNLVDLFPEDLIVSAAFPKSSIALSESSTVCPSGYRFPSRAERRLSKSSTDA